VFFFTVSENIIACYFSEEEQKLLAKQEAGDNSDALGARLNEIYEELHITGADSAESRVWAGGGGAGGVCGGKDCCMGRLGRNS
jgi:hypothetical protein